MNFERLRSAQQRIADAGGNRLGSLLWWSLNDNRIDEATLCGIAQRHGLSEKYLPRPIKPTQAFRRAWRHA